MFQNRSLSWASQMKFRQVMKTGWAWYCHLKKEEPINLWSVCCKDWRKGFNVMRWPRRRRHCHHGHNRLEHPLKMFFQMCSLIFPKRDQLNVMECFILILSCVCAESFPDPTFSSLTAHSGHSWRALCTSLRPASLCRNYLQKCLIQMVLRQRAEQERHRSLIFNTKNV